MPRPALIWLTDFDEGPELKEPAPMRPMNSMDIQAQSSFGQCADATDACM